MNGLANLSQVKSTCTGTKGARDLLRVAVIANDNQSREHLCNPCTIKIEGRVARRERVVLTIDPTADVVDIVYS